MTNNTDRQCDFSDAIVSYIYDEIESSARLEFEDHLPDCAWCIDEFAAISGARLSVYEVRRDVFDELATPAILIPYGSAEPAGLIDRLRAVLAGFATPIPLAAAGVLLAAFVAFLTLRSGDVPTVADQITPAPEPEKAVVAAAAVPEVIPAPADEPKVESAAAIKPRKDQKPAQPVRVSERKPVRTTIRRAETAQTAQVTRPTAAKAPTLSNYSESDDRSLRLTDLFSDEIGSIRR